MLKINKVINDKTNKNDQCYHYLGVCECDAHHPVGLGAPAGPVLKLDNRELVIFTSPLTRSFHSAHIDRVIESLSPT